MALADTLITEIAVIKEKMHNTTDTFLQALLRAHLRETVEKLNKILNP
jgi:hypothetical protein